MPLHKLFRGFRASCWDAVRSVHFGGLSVATFALFIESSEAVFELALRAGVAGDRGVWALAAVSVLIAEDEASVPAVPEFTAVGAELELVRLEDEPLSALEFEVLGEVV